MHVDNLFWKNFCEQQSLLYGISIDSSNSNNNDIVNYRLQFISNLWSIKFKLTKQWYKHFKAFISKNKKQYHLLPYIPIYRVSSSPSSSSVHDLLLLTSLRTRFHKVFQQGNQEQQQETNQQQVSMAIVGSGKVGKTSLLMTFANHGLVFPENYVPSMCDYQTVPFECTNCSKEGSSTLSSMLALYDTCNEEDRLRPLIYARTTVVVIAFSVADPFSFETIKNKWIVEVRHHLPDTPILLCATKCDLRTDKTMIDILQAKNTHMVTTEEGEAMAKEIRAIAYVETSAKMNSGLNTCFEAVVAAHYLATCHKEDVMGLAPSETKKQCIVQ